MNNVEIYDDFVGLMKIVHPNVHLDQRDEMLLRMAINHACLCLAQITGESDSEE